MRGTGWVPDRPDYRDKLYTAIAAPPKKLPKKVDLRRGCSRVEDQGQLGSCTANALVGNLEFLQKKAGHRVSNLSRLLVSPTNARWKGRSMTTRRMIRDGVKTLVKLGVCSERKWPYKIAKFTNKPPDACYKEASDHQVTSYHRIISLHQMRQCLAEGYPFVFGFSVYEAFESDAVAGWQLNRPEPSERQLGGHAVMAVGYDD